MVYLTNDSGFITKTYKYDCYGKEENESNTDTNPYRYYVEYYDKESKHIYLRARYYTSATGRFTQEDLNHSQESGYKNIIKNEFNLNSPFIEFISLLIYLRSDNSLIITNLVIWDNIGEEIKKY